jgi:cytochrome d ubiquinol oxidase subunit I
MEAHFHTQASAPLIIGGVPDEKNSKVRYALKIPGLLSFMAHGNFKAEVKGLDQIPAGEHPPVAVTHYAFQVMVGLGMAMFFIALIYCTALWKKRKWLESGWLLRLFVAATPMGFIAVEAGWTVTDVGRQPWIIYGIMKTADAVTPMPGIVYSFYLYTAVYISLAVVVTFMLYRQIKMVGALYDTVPTGKPANP